MTAINLNPRLYKTWKIPGAQVTGKGSHFPTSVTLYAVYFYVRFAVSYRDLEEIMAERGVHVDHATLNRWVVKYASMIAQELRNRSRPVSVSWRMDETYIKVKGRWAYLYRAVDNQGQTIDFMLSAHRRQSAARNFFRNAIAKNGVPKRVVVDKSGSNLAGLQNVNAKLRFKGDGSIIKIVQSKYLNNLLEQDHRFIKKITKPMMSFKAFHSAQSTLAGIEVAHMIRKQQIVSNHKTGFQIFVALAA